MLQSDKSTDLLNEQLNTEETPNSSLSSNEKLVYEKQYLDTGLYVRGDEKGYYITAGHYIVSPIYETPGDAENAIFNRDYKLLMGIIDAMILFNDTYRNESLTNQSGK